MQSNHNEYLLAELFFTHPQKVFSKYSLLDLIWNRNTDLESNCVEATISSLRKKLKNSGANFSIKSRRNIGYCSETIPHF
ncbi:MAG: helix-turn-helix domain-containing protein [Bdellovibrionaceae bacterium]|nr:helix-turn-helix domain-containing protein [Pseudobdellovibrionaceae bacterium]